MVKNFKNRFFGTKRPMTLKRCIQHRIGYSSTTNISYDDLGLTLTIFMTGSNLFPNVSAWVKAYTALSAYVLRSLFLSTQVSDTGPVVLWFAMANQEETSSKCSSGTYWKNYHLIGRKELP